MGFCLLALSRCLGRGDEPLGRRAHHGGARLVGGAGHQYAPEDPDWRSRRRAVSKSSEWAHGRRSGRSPGRPPPSGATTRQLRGCPRGASRRATTPGRSSTSGGDAWMPWVTHVCGRCPPRRKRAFFYPGDERMPVPRRSTISRNRVFFDGTTSRTRPCSLLRAMSLTEAPVVGPLGGEDRAPGPGGAPRVPCPAGGARPASRTHR